MPGGLADLKALRQAEAVAPDTVELELTRPQISCAGHLIAMGIVPQARHGDGHARNPVGAGPFRMVEWREGEQRIVEPNPTGMGPTSRSRA
ncbi:MAG: hypothetical protein MUF73_17525 [Rhodobacteraceae bacterium]|jgi:peptide/nickel transport system substrate-binding protein|nr:hypothetical protein [Paracoccaceae bacterium]